MLTDKEKVILRLLEYYTRATHHVTKSSYNTTHDTRASCVIMYARAYRYSATKKYCVNYCKNEYYIK